MTGDATYRITGPDRVSWTRWDARRRRMVTTHPTVWTVTDHDGTQRVFDTKRAAQTWVADQTTEAAAP